MKVSLIQTQNPDYTEKGCDAPSRNVIKRELSANCAGSFAFLTNSRYPFARRAFSSYTMDATFIRLLFLLHGDEKVLRVLSGPLWCSKLQIALPLWISLFFILKLRHLCSRVK